MRNYSLEPKNINLLHFSNTYTKEYLNYQHKNLAKNKPYDLYIK